jgi:hypothetical protein
VGLFKVDFGVEVGVDENGPQVLLHLKMGPVEKRMDLRKKFLKTEASKNYPCLKK